MSQTVKLDNLGTAVADVLSDYSGVVFDDLKEAVDIVSKECTDEIKQNALGFNWKDYAKTWTRTKEKSKSATGYKFVVHAKSGGYQIAHLLEHGHAKKNGGRTRACPHIAPAEAHGEQRFISLLRQKIGGN